MNEQPELKIEDCARLELAPGDVIVYRHPKAVDRFAAAKIKDELGKGFPDHRILVLDDGAELSAIRPTDPEEDNAWRLSTLQFLLRRVDEAMVEEGVAGSVRRRITNRLFYGEPTTDTICRVDDQRLAPDRSL